MILVLSVLLACQRTPVVVSVDPVEVPAGEIVRVHGENFGQPVQVALKTDDGLVVALEDISVLGPGEIAATVPLRTSPGQYDVVVTVEGLAHGMPRGLVVGRPREDAPCSGEYTANTQLSLVRKQVVIDRFHRDGERETLHIAADDVERIEYERRPIEAGGSCAVIWLRLKDGGRVVFDDDLAIDLEDRARRMSGDLDKPFLVTGKGVAP